MHRQNDSFSYNFKNVSTCFPGTIFSDIKFQRRLLFKQTFNVPNATCNFRKVAIFNDLRLVGRNIPNGPTFPLNFLARSGYLTEDIILWLPLRILTHQKKYSHLQLHHLSISSHLDPYLSLPTDPSVL